MIHEEVKACRLNCDSRKRDREESDLLLFPDPGSGVSSASASLSFLPSSSHFWSKGFDDFVYEKVALEEEPHRDAVDFRASNSVPHLEGFPCTKDSLLF